MSWKDRGPTIYTGPWLGMIDLHTLLDRRLTRRGLMTTHLGW